MPKKQVRETPEQQFERFEREAQKLIDAGELNPTEAAEALDKMLRSERPAKFSRAGDR